VVDSKSSPAKQRVAGSACLLRAPPSTIDAPTSRAIAAPRERMLLMSSREVHLSGHAHCALHLPSQSPLEKKFPLTADSPNRERQNESPKRESDTKVRPKREKLFSREFALLRALDGRCNAQCRMAGQMTSRDDISSIRSRGAGDCFPRSWASMVEAAPLKRHRRARRRALAGLLFRVHHREAQSPLLQGSRRTGRCSFVILSARTSSDRHDWPCQP